MIARAGYHIVPQRRQGDDVEGEVSTVIPPTLTSGYPSYIKGRRGSRPSRRGEREHVRRLGISCGRSSSARAQPSAFTGLASSDRPR